MVNVGIFYYHLEYFMAIWYNLWPFCIVCSNLLYFSQFGMFGPRKIWQPCCIPWSVSFSFFRACPEGWLKGQWFPLCQNLGNCYQRTLGIGICLRLLCKAPLFFIEINSKANTTIYVCMLKRYFILNC
jgi:hypothetical protein